MKTLSIRQWLLLSWLATVIIPYLLWNVTAAVQSDARQEIDQRQAQALSTALAEVSGNAARWRDPLWQGAVGTKLAALGVDVVIRDATQNEIYRRVSDNDNQSPDQQVVVMDGPRRLGAVELSIPFRGGNTWRSRSTVSALLAAGLTLFAVAWLMGHWVLRPLAAMSGAARQIAAGDLNFDLPPSQVREVAEVAAAFHAMGDGLRDALERQARLEEERRLFVGAIAHDLRTPLFALRGYLEGLERGLAATPEKAAHYIAVCQEKAAALERLIAGLFAYARLEYLEQSPRRAPLELGELLRRAVEELRPQAEAKAVTLHLDGPAAPCPLEGDEQLLGRAVGNLLDNALRHTPPGGAIEVRWWAEPGELHFSVADSGPGIAAHDLPHLFTPLYRGEPSRSRDTGGAGLGLTIARRILRAHGGNLSAANRPAGGAEFTGSLASSL